MLTNQDIINYQEIYKSEFGIEISDADARDQATALLNLMSQVYVPMTQKEFEEVEKHRESKRGDLEQRFD